MPARAIFSWKIFTRVILIQTLLLLAAILVAGLGARMLFQQTILGQARDQLNVELQAALAAYQAAPLDPALCDRLAASLRSPGLALTIRRPDGGILCESSDPHGLGASAVSISRELSGSGARLSATLSLPSMDRALRIYDTAFALFILLLALALALFALRLGRKLVFPLGRLLLKTQNVLKNEKEALPTDDLNEPKEDVYGEDIYGKDVYGEWSELESSIDDIRRDLQTKVESLTVEREEHATLMSAISDAILAVDTDGQPLFYNSRFALFAGTEELKNRKRLWEIFRQPEILGAYQGALREGKPTSVKAIPFELPAGRQFFALAVSPLRKSHGGAPQERIYGAVGIFHDVTDLKAAEQIRIDFVANVSHELRTPLTAIKGYADTLMMDAEEGKPAAREFLEVIKRNSERLMSLINDLLDLSSIESTDVLQKTTVSTEEATRRVVHQLQGALSKKNHRLEIRTTATSVHADPKRLEQVLVNLLDNAIKYTPPGGLIRISWEPTRSTAGGQDDVLLKISDSGPGIPPEHVPRLFERFYRVDKARSRDQGGTGLGLAIVKHIIQRHDGNVWVESKVGRGSTFICQFPAER